MISVGSTGPLRCPCWQKEVMPLTLSHLVPSFFHCPLAPCVTWWGCDKCLSWHCSLQTDGCECTHSSHSHRQEIEVWMSKFLFRDHRYIIERVLQSLVQRWSRTSTTKGHVLVLLESAVREESEQAGNAPSVPLCGKRVLEHKSNWLFLSQMSIYEQNKKVTSPPCNV